MKRLLYSGLFSLVLCPLLVSATQTTFTNGPAQTFTYVNDGTTVTPQIDAVNVVKYGLISVSTARGYTDFGVIGNLLFETLNTLNYTNFGEITGGSGFRFSHNTDTSRGMASSFINYNPAVVDAEDLLPAWVFTVPGANPQCFPSRYVPSFLIIHATNIVTSAGGLLGGPSLVVGNNGLMELIGKNVDLSYSGLLSRPIPAGNTTFLAPPPATQYVPDGGIYDTYWVQTNLSDAYTVSFAPLWNGTSANAQGVPSPPTQPQGFPAPAFSLPDPVSSFYVNSELLNVTVTNSDGSISIITLRSNITKGAFFIQAPPGFVSSGSFSPSPQANNRFQTPLVGTLTSFTDPVSGASEPAGFLIQDLLASDTRERGLSFNDLYCATNTFRPANYEMARTTVPIVAGFTNNPPPANFFLTSGNDVFVQPPTEVLMDSVTNAFSNAGSVAGYGAHLDNRASRPEAVPGGTITNAPGRIMVTADNLDLTETRMRADGWIQIKTANLISSSNAVIDCESLSFDLGSAGGNLKVESIVPGGNVTRLSGDVKAWSATWSNSVVVILDNYTATNSDPNNTNVITYIQTPITNTLNVGYHVLMVDASLLATATPITVYDFAARSRNLTFNDSMNIVQTLFIDGRTFTLNGTINLPGTYPANQAAPVTILTEWLGTNAPNLAFFTNNGTLNVVNRAHFGDDRPRYAALVNRGTIRAVGIAANSAYLENTGGTLAAGGSLLLQGDQGKFNGGTASAGTASVFTFGDLKFNSFTLNSSGKLFVNVSQSLSDAGPASGNLFQLVDGFSQTIKPVLGDLLGTRFESFTPATPVANVNHVWAGEDRGPGPAGFTNNTALGSLKLIPQTTTGGWKFTFSGAGAHNGLYVDVLDLSSINSSSDLLSKIKINNSLVIYFASASLGFTPPNDTNGVPQQPEEYLDGLFGGHLRWARTFAGPNSSVMTVDGPVNRALINSQIVDSDGDSLPNAADTTPFQFAAPSVGINGNGFVNPNLDGQPLIIGEVYSMTAQPAPGASFGGWSGSVETSSPTVIFTNDFGLSFVANFTFTLNPGVYNGLFYQSDGIQLLQSGFFTAKATKTGTYSGSVILADGKIPFSGQVDESGHSTANSSLLMDLQFSSNRITGTIGDGNWEADLIADRAVFGKTNPAPFAGTYTVIFPGSGDLTNSELPLGDGFGSVTVDSLGKVTLKGSLADGTKISQTSTVSEDGSWPLFIPLYSGQGQLLGWMTFENTGAKELSGLVSWIKEPNVSAKFFPDGFTLETNAVGSTYIATNSPVTGFNGGFARLTGGNLDSDIVNPISVSPDSKLTALGTNKLTLTINTSQGLFKGSVKNPETGKTIKINGAILQNQGLGSGYFLGTNQSGRIVIGP